MKSKEKRAIFESLGFTDKDSQKLKLEFEKQSLANYLIGNYLLKNLDSNGQRLAIPITLAGKTFYTGWMLEPEGSRSKGFKGTKPISLADAYIKIAEMHVTIYNLLHEKMVMLIEEQKNKGVQVPASMQAIWDYEHEKLIKEFAESKYLIEEYKKMGY